MKFGFSSNSSPQNWLKLPNHGIWFCKFSGTMWLLDWFKLYVIIRIVVLVLYLCLRLHVFPFSLCFDAVDFKLFSIEFKCVFFCCCKFYLLFIFIWDKKVVMNGGFTPPPPPPPLPTLVSATPCSSCSGPFVT